jgi:hypothetical protein
MGAPDLIQWLRRDGLALSLLPSGGLAVQPASKLTDEHREAIRHHRDALVLALTDGANLKEPEADDPDRHSWPYTTAMNSAEIDAFTARGHLFTRRGLDEAEAEKSADGLVIRDRGGDDRRLCLECQHLRGIGPYRCGNARAADVHADVARDLVLTLQRCHGYLDACLPIEKTADAGHQHE